MAVLKYKLTILQGESLDKTFTWKAGLPPVPVDLTGCTARMHIRSDIRAATPAIELSTENGRIVLGGAAGTIRLKLSATETSSLNISQGVYDLEIVYPDGRVRRFAAGAVSVSPEVTR